MAPIPAWWPAWFKTWWPFPNLPDWLPPDQPPPGPYPATGGPVLGPVTTTVTALPLGAPKATRALGPAETTTGVVGALTPRGSLSLAAPPLPTTPPVLADAPTFYARGEPGEPDLAGARPLIVTGTAGYQVGVDADDDTGASAYAASSAGPFYVDTDDGWTATSAVTVEAWIRPGVTAPGRVQTLLDCRSHHRRYGPRWGWQLRAFILEVFYQWYGWRGFEVFRHWFAWQDWCRFEGLQEWLGWSVYLYGSNLVASFGTGYGEGTVFAPSVSIPARQWTHIAATCDGALRRLYVNGALVASASYDGYLPPVPGVDLAVGKGCTTASGFDEIAVFGYALTPEQVLAHYHGVGGGSSSGGFSDTTVALPMRPVGSRPVGLALDSTTGLPLQPRARNPIVRAYERDIALPLGPVVTDQALADAIADGLRTPIYTVRADWNRSGQFDHPLSDLTELVTELSIDRALAGDLPEEVGLVEGNAAAALSITLEGQWDDDDDTGITGAAHPGIDPVAAFAPYNPDAALYGYPTIGTPIEVDVGFLTREGRKLKRRFTGEVSKVMPSSAGRKVVVEALDPANGMHAPITQQATGMDGISAAFYGPDRYNSRTNSQWLIDRIFRANGLYASPPAQPGTFVSATMHGSAIPEIGSGGMPRSGSASPSNPAPWRRDGHPFGMLYPNQDAPPQNGYWTSPQILTMAPGDGFGVSFWCRMPSTPISPFLFAIFLDGGPVGPGGTTAGHYAVLVTLTNGAPLMTVYTPANLAVSASVPWQRPTRDTWMFIGMHWSFQVHPQTTAQLVTTNIPVDCVMTLNINGDNYDPYPTTLNVGNIRPNPWAPSTTIEYFGEVPFTNVSWFSAPVAPLDSEWVGQSWTPQADIDPGLNELTGIPQINGEDSWSLATEVAAAEAASIGFSVDGRPFFKSRAVKHPRVVAVPVTADRDLSDLATTTDEAAVRNSISTAITPLYVDNYEWVHDSKDPAEFESGPGTTYFPIHLPQDTVLVEPWYAYQMPRAYWDAYNDHPYFRSSWIYAAVYADVASTPVPFNYLYLNVYPSNPGEAIIAVYNYTGRTVRFQTENTTDSSNNVSYGSAAFKLPGRLLKAQATVPQSITDPGSVALFGERTFELGTSSDRWHQYPSATQGIAEAILSSTAHPSPVLDTIEVLHDPRRDLDQAISVEDPYGLGVVRGSIVGVTNRLATGDAALDDLTVRPVCPPGFGILGDPEFGRVGQTLRFGA